MPYLTALTSTPSVRSYSVADSAGAKPSRAQGPASVSGNLQEVENKPAGFSGLLSAVRDRAHRIGEWVHTKLDSIRNSKASSAQRETGDVRIVSMSSIGNDRASRESSMDISFASSNDVSRTAKRDTFSAESDPRAYRQRSDADQSAALRIRSHSDAARAGFTDRSVSTRIIQSGLQYMLGKFPDGPPAEGQFIPAEDTALREPLGALGVLLEMGDILKRDDGTRSTALEHEAYDILLDAVGRVIERVSPDATLQYDAEFGLFRFDKTARHELAEFLRQAKRAAHSYVINAGVERLMERLVDVHRWGQRPLVPLWAEIPRDDAEGDAGLDPARRAQFDALVRDVKRCTIDVTHAVLKWVKEPVQRMPAEQASEPLVAVSPARMSLLETDL